MKALVFDLDGTLVDSLADIASAMNAALVEHGLPTHGLPAYRRFVGEGVEVLTAHAVAPHQQWHGAVLQRYRTLYAQGLPGTTRPFPGIVDLLLALQSRGVGLAVLSNKPDASTRHLVAQLFPQVSWAGVAGQKADVPRKPDPTAALDLARTLGVAPHECGFVGDSAIDMRTAGAAGMRGIGVTWGFRDRAELEQHGAHAIVDTPAQVLALLP